MSTEVSAEVQHNAAHGSKNGATFNGWYNSYWNGRGIWKWNNALDAYQRHFTALTGQRLKLVEVGVQSGGAIAMWRTVLGARCHVYGVDNDPHARMFADPMATIVVGDEASIPMWTGFFQYTSRGMVDVVVVTGGRQTRQLLVTLIQTFDHLTPGGMIAFEDLHNRKKTDDPFFNASLEFLSHQNSLAQVASVHLYPFMMLVQRAGNDQRSPLSFDGSSTVVSTFSALWEAVPKHPGGRVILENPKWGSFLAARILNPIMRMFDGLHAAKTWRAMPRGCTREAAEVCSMTMRPTPMQKVIKGVHIYPQRLVVEVAGTHVLLQAVRRGTYWRHDGPALQPEKLPDG